MLIAVTRDFCFAEGVWETSPAACPSLAYRSAGGSRDEARALAPCGRPEQGEAPAPP